jgi:hypothetical protein
MANVAIGIIFGATRIIFKYSLTSACFPDPAEASYMEKEVSSLPETSGFPKERQKLIYFRFQIDVLNIEFYFSFYRNSALLHGISSPDNGIFIR